MSEAVHRLTVEQARRIAVRAQLLEASRPRDLLALVEHLTRLPIDMTAAVAPARDLVAWSRLGGDHHPDDLVDALAARELFEDLHGIRPMSDLGLYAAGWATWPPWEPTRQWMEANELFRAEILDALTDEGPMLAKEISASPQTPWRSSGWNEGRSVSLMLECLQQIGEVAIDGRSGNQRRWNLASRVHPESFEIPSPEVAARTLGERRLAALGIARASGTKIPDESIYVGDVGEPAAVEGIKGRFRVDPAYLTPGLLSGDASEPSDFAGRAALLSPFDALVTDRVRMAELFGFDYALEMYKPAAKRRWGYFALPILVGERLVGKLDATADRKEGRLFVDAVHEDGRWTGAVRSAVGEEVDALAQWLGLVRTDQG